MWSLTQLSAKNSKHAAQIHAQLITRNYLSSPFLFNSLLNLYCKCAHIFQFLALFSASNASTHFDDTKNVFIYTSFITQLSHCNLPFKALSFFNEMRERNVSPNHSAFSAMHSLICKHGFESDMFVSSALVGRVFDEMPERNLVSWNSAIGFFANLIVEDVIRPDQVSFSSVLSACANVAMERQGHGIVVKHGLDYLAYVKNSLMDMYCKCGVCDDAKKLFTTIEDRDVDGSNYFWVMRREGILFDEASFSTMLHAAAGDRCTGSGSFDELELNVISRTAMISAFQQHGCANQSDYITYVYVLSACGHTGRVDDGFSYFHLLSQRYNMNPGLEHYACMVDLLGRAGLLHYAERLVETMPIEPDVFVWGALLGACTIYGHLDLGKEVAERLFQIEPDNAGNFMLLCNMYASRGRLEEANEVRRLMGFNRVRKEPGCSCLDVKNTTHVLKLTTNEIYEMLGKLEELVKQKGYVPEIQYAINDVDEYKEWNLWYHREKLALAYGLLILPVGAPIGIKKTLRTCGDCHIVMKDINCFHQFADGLCSCGDYWWKTQL
ncbi:hypothetical protein Pfo_002155 [Paulownia fortunei]|nr:hypothetical protein Pfo_002155 [Paulownia fortunei]